MGSTRIAKRGQSSREPSNCSGLLFGAELLQSNLRSGVFGGGLRITDTFADNFVMDCKRASANTTFFYSNDENGRL